AYFDTLRFEGTKQAEVRERAEQLAIDFRYFADGAIGVAVDETTTIEDVADICTAFTGRNPVPRGAAAFKHKAPATLQRASPYLTHPVFNTHHSETKMMRYIRSLERKDVGLDTSMI